MGDAMSTDDAEEKTMRVRVIVGCRNGHRAEGTAQLALSWDRGSWSAADAVGTETCPTCGERWDRAHAWEEPEA